MKECSSRKVLIVSMSTEPKKLSFGQQGQGQEVVLNDQGEGYQQLKEGVPIQNFKLEPKFHYSIPWA